LRQGARQTGGGVDRLSPARERRRVEHDEPEAPSFALKLAEHVAGVAVHHAGAVPRFVEREVLVGPRDRFR